MATLQIITNNSYIRHSRHGEAQPSIGDLENITALLAGTYHKWFVLCIVGIDPERSEAEVAAYLFSSSLKEGQEPIQMNITLVEGSHDYYAISDQLEDLRFPGRPKPPVVLRDAEYPSQSRLPVPESTVEATEKRNVISLTLQ